MNRSRLLLKKIDLVAIGIETLLTAQNRVMSCERCNHLASMSFETLLDDVTGRQRAATEYVLSQPARCLSCSAPVMETTLVHFESPGTDAGPVFEPRWEETNVVPVDVDTVLAAQELLVGCEHCAPDTEIAMDYILDSITGCDPTCTEYVMCQPAKCPNCAHEITEKTLVVVG